ncbi:Lrp/AsnC family transcriptional regulator [Rhizorhabdus phycosphaerae]|uniref:Lrp/AsnC family transcriptional regulator n=1 Tax=Rhizorhabdus phycosphaerae TaxID=2711156 RepID=UPI0013ED8AA0|nr:Lrp/AsnC family transcriptional regulator [Rhizorhabdus phycosphaerae]
MLDATDRRILTHLQKDATLSLAALAEASGLSQTPCWKRVKRLEREGYIRGRVTLLDPAKIGLKTVVFVGVRANEHSEDWLSLFARSIAEIPEVTEFYRMSGETDYLLKIVCADIDDYDRIYKRIIRAAPLRDVTSSFAMEQIKYSTALPL